MDDNELIAAVPAGDDSALRELFSRDGAAGGWMWGTARRQAALDPEQWMAFRELLRDLGQRSTVVMSTHLVEDVGAACGQVALMGAGKIVFHGASDELTDRGSAMVARP